MDKTGAEPVLELDVRLDGFYEVRGKQGEACMILFHGTAGGPLFQGSILPGGVDTQMQRAGETRFLSARYMLEGVDADGGSCRIFIENNGAIGPDGIATRPRIFTDSAALSWLEDAALYGTVEENGEKRVRICFYRAEESTLFLS